MVGFDDIDDDDRDEILHLEKSDIDQEADGETLCRWYRISREFADDVIAQIETNKISGFRDDEWSRRASGMLIGIKKGMKAIERRANSLGVSVPRMPTAKDDERVKKLQEQLVEARTFERNVIVEWLEDQYGKDAAPVIAALNDRAHHAHRRAKAERAREAA